MHYRLVGGYLWVFYRAATRVLGLRVEVEGPDPDAYLGRPLLVFCRHAGPGDSFLLLHALVNWYAREPRIVLNDTLQWDPAIDVVLNRLPNRFLSTGGAVRRAPDRRAGDRARRQRRVRDLPRGRQLHRTPAGRRHRAVAGPRSRRGGPARGGDAPRAAAAARRRAAALTAAPEADVVLVAHTGLDHLFTVADVWRELPLDTVVRMRWWRVPAGDVPPGFDAQVHWLYTWWEQIDAWVDAARAGR